MQADAVQTRARERCRSAGSVAATKPSSARLPAADGERAVVVQQASLDRGHLSAEGERLRSHQLRLLCLQVVRRGSSGRAQPPVRASMIDFMPKPSRRLERRSPRTRARRRCRTVGNATCGKAGCLRGCPPRGGSSRGRSSGLRTCAIVSPVTPAAFAAVSQRLSTRELAPCRQAPGRGSAVEETKPTFQPRLAVPVTATVTSAALGRLEAREDLSVGHCIGIASDEPVCAVEPEAREGLQSEEPLVAVQIPPCGVGRGLAADPARQELAVPRQSWPAFRTGSRSRSPSIAWRERAGTDVGATFPTRVSNSADASACSRMFTFDRAEPGRRTPSAATSAAPPRNLSRISLPL